MVSEKDIELELPKEIAQGINEPFKVCFVCTGNTCRSPMAAAVLNHLGGGYFQAESAGLSAVNGDAIAENARLALEKAGIEPDAVNDYRFHYARNIDENTVKKSDRIVAMTESHFMQLIYRFPQYASKISVMEKDIPDPFMGNYGVYEKCLDLITECLKGMFEL